MKLPNAVVVAASSVEKAVQYRQVCKAFDHCIIDIVSHRAAHLSLTRLFRHSGYNGVFNSQGGKVLSKRLLRSHSRQHAVMDFVRGIVSHLLEQEWVVGSQFENLRFQYTLQISNSLMAIDSELLHEYLTRRKTLDVFQPCLLADIRPAIAAALGDSSILLRSTISYQDLVSTSCELFPNALNAAVASGQTEVLSVALKYITDNVKGKPQAENWDDMRLAARSIGQALRTVIRLHKNDAGRMMFDWLYSNRVFRDSMTLYFGEQLVKDCLRYGNGELIYVAMAYKTNGAYATCQAQKLG